MAAATPRAFLCSITCDVMVRLGVSLRAPSPSVFAQEIPVVAADGHSYERAAMQEWLRAHDTSPLTNEVLAHTTLVQNIALRHAIEEWQAQQVSRYLRVYIGARYART